MTKQSNSAVLFQVPQIKHRYGKNISILSSPHLNTMMANLGHPATKGFQVCNLTRHLFQYLLHYAISSEMPVKVEETETRMTKGIPKKFQQKYQAPILDQKTQVVVGEIARAGILPSQVCYEELTCLYPADNVRQDHFYLSRVQKGNRITIDCAGSKVGGDVQNRIVIIPDPMGATGESVKYCIDYYLNQTKSKGVKFILLHLIVTPDYIRNLKKLKCPFSIFALRVDRGMSEKKIRESVPGEFLAEETGLNSDHYIVPGAGGLGEVLNNSFV